MEWGSRFVYQGESEEEEITKQELEEKMWISDDDDIQETKPLSSSRQNHRRSFLGSLLKRVRSKKKSRKAKIPADQNDYRDNSSDEEDVKQKPIQSKPDDEENSETQIHLLDDELTPSLASNTAIASPSVSGATPNPPAQPPVKVKKLKKKRVLWDKSYTKNSQGVKTRRADTNILGVKFNTLRESGNLHTGDAQFCSNAECGAVVSHLTKLIGDDDSETKNWNCEFCGTVTELDIVPDEIPTIEDTTYLITPAAVLAEGGGSTGMDESLVVFCIDTSGSMCVTTEVSGHYDIRGAKEKQEKLLESLPTSVAADARQPEYRLRHGSRSNVTWISRMESLQAAIDSQLAHLVHSEPNKRVCLVTFSDDVTIIGDGRMVPVTIAGDKLSDTKAVIDIGKGIGLPASIRETQKPLSKKVFSMEESGQTALGPAVLVSVVIASQKPGSKVVICTDGLANIGLGSLDVAAANAKAYAAAENFYENLGDIAMDKGVTVSLLSIKGSDCRVVELGQVANRTGGQVTLVNPLTVTEEFGSILNNPVIATDVVAKIILHNGLYFRNEDSKDSVIIKQVGNVTADTELTYEYGIRATKKKVEGDDDVVKSKGATASSVDKEVPPQIVNGEPQLPFQLQLEYTSSDGDRCLRVITQTKPVTKDRKVAEKVMDTGIIGSHVAKQAAELTMQGEFTKARVKSLATQRMLQENSRSNSTRREEYNIFCTNLMPLDGEILRMQQTETSRGLNHSDDEQDIYHRDSDLALTSLAAPSQRRYGASSISFGLKKSSNDSSKKMRSSKEASRRKEISDDLAQGLFVMKNSSITSYRFHHDSD